MTGTVKTTEFPLLITGGAGFIGSHFVDHLFKTTRSKIIVLDALTYAGDISNLYHLEPAVIFPSFVENTLLIQKPEPEWKRVNSQDEFERFFFRFLESKRVIVIVMDIGNIESFSVLKNVDSVIHFAAETHVDRSILDQERFIKTNILGTYKLLRFFNSSEIRKFLHISTDEVYGPCLNGSFDENQPFNPTNPYAASKSSSDILALSFFKTFGMPVIIARPSNTYGPRQFPEKFIPLTISKVLSNEKIPIYGDGNQKRDWIYVEDVISALFLLLEKGKEGESYNIGGIKTYRNIEIARKVCGLMGVSSEDLISYVNDRPGHDLRYFLNSEKSKKLGWESRVSIEEGLKRTIEWFRKNEKKPEDPETLKFFSQWYAKR